MVENTPTTIKLNNGLEMPLCGYGSYKTDELADIIYTVLKSGVRLIDTALYYKNEKEIGEGIAKALKDGIVKREEIYLTTKIWMDKYDNIEETLKSQLKSLQVEYVDLYLLHWPLQKMNEKGEPPKLPMYKIWGTMESMVKKGLTKSIGVSNFCTQLLLDMMTYCEIRPAVNQFEIHPYSPRTELIEFCQKFGIQVNAYNSLMKGVYVNNEDGKYDLFKEPLIQELSKKYGKSEAQICLNFSISQNVVVIPKSSSEKRIKENYESVNFRLSDEDVKKLQKLDSGKLFCMGIKNLPGFGNFNPFI